MKGDRHYLQRFEILATRYAMLLNIAEQLIAKHGIARNIEEDCDGKHTFHDYLLLCLTKATKTFGSNYILIIEFRGEDALILTRSIYESYLSVSFLLAHPSEINSLVAGRVGLNSGDFERKRNKIVDSESQKEVGSLISVGHMGKNTRWPEDEAIHKFIYPHLCSYSHMDIFTLDQYLEGSRFTTMSPHRIYQAGLYSFFFFALLMDEFSLFKGFNKKERKRISSSLNTSKKFVVQILEHMQSNPENGDTPDRFLNRWKHLGNHWNT